MASVPQYFSGQQNTERTDSIYNNSKPIVTFIKVDSASVYVVISAANKLKSRVLFTLTLTLRMTSGR